MKAGLHPFVVWPEMAEHATRSIEKACAECGQPFTPYRPTDRFCSRPCGSRHRQREYWARKTADPAFRAAEAERQARYRADAGERFKARELARLRAWEAARKSTGLMSSHTASTDSDAEVA